MSHVKLPVMLFLCISYLSFSLLGFAEAQRVRLLSGGIVSFSPSQLEIEEALSCADCVYLSPITSTVDSVLRVQRQGSKSYTLQARQLALGQGLALEARYLIDYKGQKPSQQTDWLELSSLSQDLFSSDASVVDITIEYRLRLTTEAAAGVQSVAVVYSTGTSTIQQQINLVLPGLAIVRVITAQDGANPELNFDYQGLNVREYLDRVQANQQLMPTSSSIEKIELYTNHPRGATVRLELFILDLEAELENKLFLAEQPIISYRFSLNRPSNGFEVFALPSDFTLLLTGAEKPGTYRYIIRYRSSPNP